MSQLEFRIEHVMNEGVGNPVGKQNTGYEYTTPSSFQEAKQFSDKVYIQALKNHQAQYEEGSNKYDEIQDFIDAGPLNFSDSGTYKLLTNKDGSFIKDPNNFLRYAVEHQADVMKDYLQANDIDISKKAYGQGDVIGGSDVFLNTGTGAHIDFNTTMGVEGFNWETQNGELGQYNQYQYREPEMQMSDKILSNPLVNLAATIYGGPQAQALLTAARGGDIEDIIKGAATGYLGDVTSGIISDIVPIDLVEDTLGSLGIDADLFGLDAETFTEGLGNVQQKMLEGDSGKEALLKEFGGEALDALGVDLPEFKLPETGVIGDIRELGRTIDDTLLQPFKGAVETVTEPVVDFLDEGVDYIGKEVVDPALQALDDVLPHGETPELPEGPDIDLPDVDVDLKLAKNEPTQVESLFGNEIGGIYRTPVKAYKPAFSEQEIQGMLSQRFRG